MIKKVLDQLERDEKFQNKVEHIENIPSKLASYEKVVNLPKELDNYLQNNNIKIYQHQAKAINLIRNGKNVLITTPTASGKTLAFNIPVLEALIKDPMATALYIYPAKALANDQLNVLRHLEKKCGLDFKPNIYDGDTPKDLRPWIKENARLILTNPYMLHLTTGWHHQWARFYSNLKYVVIDEAHQYRGVFGSNVAFLIRRLRRICKYYGSDPQFILSSATLANPEEFSHKLVGKDFELVAEDTSPSGEKHFILYNPYADTGQLSTHQETKILFQLMVLNDLQTLCFTISRRMAEIIAMWSKNELNDFRPDLVEKITAYRAGYLADERRKIEKGLKSGKLLGVTCTNALELGVDIGSLDSVIISGYPGTMISTWQQAGRAGRGTQESLVFLVAFENALDQYLMKHPEFLFSKTHENAVIDLQNIQIVHSHLLCAVKELPLSDEELNKFFIIDQGYLDDLKRKKLIERSKKGWIYVGRGDPAWDVSLDQMSTASFKVLNNNHLLEQLDRQHAYSEAHEGAVLINQGETYIVENFDEPNKIITVTKKDVDYHTTVMYETDIDIKKELNQKTIGNFEVFYGDLEVNQNYTKYKMMLYGKVLSVFNLDLPPIQYQTKGLWFTLPEGVIDKLEKLYTGTDLYAGSLHGTEHALIAMFPLLVMCDRFDIGGVSTSYHPQTGKATIFIYDAYEGGIGLTKKAVEIMEKLVEVTRDMVKSCSCEEGCPSCIYSPKCGNENKPLHKKGTKFLLETIIRLMKSESVPTISTRTEDIRKTITKQPRASVGSAAYQEYESSQSLTDKGETFYLNENLDEALEYFQKALKLDNNNFKALKYQGMILEVQENHAEAIKSYERALKIRPDDAEALYYLSVSLFNMDKYQASKDTSQKLIKIRPDWEEPWYLLALSLKSIGDEAGAIQAFGKVLNINPDNREAKDYLKDLLT